MPIKPPIRRAVFLALTLLLTLFLVPALLPRNVHATNATYVKTVTGTQSSVTITGLTANDFLGITVWATTFGGFSCFTETDSMLNLISPIYSTCSGATTSEAWFGVAKTAGTDTVSIGCTPGGCSFSGGTVAVDQYTNVATTLGGTYHFNCGSSCPTNSGTDVLQSNIVAGNGITVWEPVSVTTSMSGTPTTITPTSTTSDGVNPAPQTKNFCAGTSSNSLMELCTFTSQVNANFPIFRAAYSGGTGTSTVDDHGDVLIQGGTPTSSSSTTSCYGNCGSPAVTLINANATHPINFNFSITLLYAFQSNINGFIINATANLAKPYVGGLRVGMAIYTATCPVNVAPFSGQCTGALAGSNNNLVGAKGFVTIPGANTAVSNGMWIAIAITTQFSGLDLNETNSICSTACVDAGHLQYTAGYTPTTLSSIARCSNAGSPCATSGIDATGLWAFLSGTVVSSLPPPTQTTCANNPQLDCIIAGAVNSFCSTLTPACQTSSALFWLLILASLTLLLLTYFLNQAMPGINIARLGLGEIGILIFLAWFAVFTSFGLLPVYLMILTFFVVAILFGKRVAGYI